MSDVIKRKFYELTEEQCSCNITKFYENCADILGVKVTDKTLFDCKKICVSGPVQMFIFQWYAEDSDTAQYDQAIGTMWLMYGPKTSINSDALIFSVEPGFIVERED